MLHKAVQVRLYPTTLQEAHLAQLPITYYLLPITYYLLPITYYLLPITYSLLYKTFG
ncbi:MULTISPECIES: helix-turn-helix domain-containing protein [Planktothrix]|uniref:helix-turn-helix domain-containing protein n=1 Tax=Planktothrix TaxID=54304 RepID=UPI00041D42D0|nr:MULTISPECIES: helix-turn-helix domain-containing protein [Planktothrix]